MAAVEPQVATVGAGSWRISIDHSDATSLLTLRIDGSLGVLSVPLAAPAGRTVFELELAAGKIDMAIDPGPPGAMLRVSRAPLWYRLPFVGRDRLLASMAVPAGAAVLRPLAYQPLAGGRQAWRRWRRSLRVMHDLGLQAAYSVGPPVARDRQSAATGRVGAHLHLFYPDLWPDCAATLANLPTGSPLHITGPALPPAVAQAICTSFPAAKLHVVENVGHDVWPFVKLLGEGAFDRLDIVLKLHAKKSNHAKLLPCVGDLWRRAAFGDLAGSPATVAAAVARFAGSPELGMLGPARMRMPNARYDEAAAWGTNRAQALAVAGRLGLVPEAVQLDYFAGTMFWVRPAMLAPLRAAALCAADFAPGGLATDGGLSHALERLLPALVKAAGGRVESVPPHLA